MGWQWHQPDHMQTICTSLQTDNHTNTSWLNFYRLDALPDAQPTVSKHWRQQNWCQQIMYKQINNKSVRKTNWTYFMRNFSTVQTDFSSLPASEDLRACLRMSSCITLIVTCGDFVRTFSCQEYLLMHYSYIEQFTFYTHRNKTTATTK